ncbi:MAG: KH domain-containing protein [Bacilli bacterium]|nr:KH domain-containing protein [Bacilli bacterium]
MELIKLTEELVKSVVKNPEDVRIKEFETDEEDNILIQVMVNESDMGAVIGKAGRIANAIRTIVQASAYINGNKKVRINIDSFEEL